ncbi:hypothetical protein JCM21738_5029 [Mesobacillus boroniphilus JCM 21738]|uniref:Uncharacterized protein n=1 Tax=Mesobacillus boroniphilus JCM 21738 TaxID=1294265 RepID=W4RUL4_9BACI|nr:hypothetical protein JCM21738_5029 [Mesobacillus boroniphilus JCM 21738]
MLIPAIFLYIILIASSFPPTLILKDNSNKRKIILGYGKNSMDVFPDLGCLRTNSQERHGILSELAVTSDNFPKLNRRFGRTWCQFGQIHAVEPAFWPNLVRLRTNSRS